MSHLQHTDPRFYGRRKGKRLTAYRQELFQTVLPTVQPINWQAVLTAQATKKNVLEIGFGKGEHLLYQARHNADTLFIGSDPFINSASIVLNNIAQEKITNIYLWLEDVHLLFKEFPFNILDEVFILFPDPWPKKRHAKRRLIQPQFLEKLIAYLKPKALLTIATDHNAYADYITTVLQDHPFFKTIPNFPTFNRPYPNQPYTNYEKKALQAGRSSRYFKYYFDPILNQV